MQIQSSKSTVERLFISLQNDEYHAVILAGLKAVHGISLADEIVMNITDTYTDGVDINIVSTKLLEQTKNGIIE